MGWRWWCGVVPDRAFGLEILRVIHGSQEGVQQTEHAGELRRVFLPLVVELVVVVVEVEEKPGDRDKSPCKHTVNSMQSVHDVT